MGTDCIRTDQIDIGVEEVDIVNHFPVYQKGMTLYLKNIGVHPVYLGRDGVTINCGYPLGKDEVIVIRDYAPAEILHGICEADKETTVAWMATINR